MDDLAAHTTWYFGFWALGPTQLGGETEASLVNGQPSNENSTVEVNDETKVSLSTTIPGIY